MSNSSSPFNSLAADYDETFTNTTIGRVMRDAVWRRLDQLFNPGDRVLEMNCGTGEDALHLARRGVRVVATDVSEAMIDRAREKITAAGLSEKVSFHLLDLTATPGEYRRVADEAEVPDKFDGAFSNFGGLNCVADPALVCSGLRNTVREGGPVVVCVMGMLVPWEWLWYSFRGRFRTAFRRLRSGGREWRGLSISYHSIGALRAGFEPTFDLLRVSGIGFLVPPPYAGSFSGKHPWVLQVLNRWERRLETTPPFPWLADHYLAELERTSEV